MKYKDMQKGMNVWILCFDRSNPLEPSDSLKDNYHPAYDFGHEAWPAWDDRAVLYWRLCEVNTVRERANDRKYFSISLKDGFEYNLPCDEHYDHHELATGYRDHHDCPGSYPFMVNGKMVYIDGEPESTPQETTPRPWWLPVNTTECECGSWSVGGGHSSWCKLSKK